MCKASSTEVRWDDTALQLICTEIDNQVVSDDCRSFGSEVRRYKQDVQDAFPEHRKRLRTAGKLGINILSMSVFEFFKVVWDRPVVVGGDRITINLK